MSGDRAYRLAELVAERGLDGLLVGDLVRPGDSGPDAIANVRWLTGFSGTSGLALLGADERLFFTDFRYAQTAGEVEGVEFVETARALVKDLSKRLSGRIAIEADFMTVAAFETLRGGGLDVVPRSGLVERLRAVKDERELDALRRACAITDRVYERLSGERFTGREERDIAWTIEQLFHEEGGEGLAFGIIVASGPNGSKPHARATDRRVCRHCVRRRGRFQDR